MKDATNFNHSQPRRNSQDILHSIFHENKRTNAFKVISTLLCDGTDPVIAVFVYHIPTNKVIQKGYFTQDGSDWVGTPSSLTKC